jgi:hypothetical protein
LTPIGSSANGGWSKSETRGRHRDRNVSGAPRSDVRFRALSVKVQTELDRRIRTGAVSKSPGLL